MKRKSLVFEAIKVIAVIMLVVGIIAFFVCIRNAGEAGRGYYTKDPVAEFMWIIGAINSIAIAISSVFAYGFSYVVEAACIYIEKKKEEDETEEQEAE